MRLPRVARIGLPTCTIARLHAVACVGGGANSQTASGRASHWLEVLWPMSSHLYARSCRSCRDPAPLPSPRTPAARGTRQPPPPRPPRRSRRSADRRRGSHAPPHACAAVRGVGGGWGGRGTQIAAQASASQLFAGLGGAGGGVGPPPGCAAASSRPEGGGGAGGRRAGRGEGCAPRGLGAWGRGTPLRAPPACPGGQHSHRGREGGGRQAARPAGPPTRSPAAPPRPRQRPPREQQR